MFEEKTVKTQKIFKGKIIDLERLTVTLPNGREATRDIVRHSGASAVLPLDEEGYVYVVSQYRKPLEKVSIEIPAGKLDDGESPLECAIRELSEETGLVAGKMRHMFSMATSPAFCDEIIHFFMATELKIGEMHTDEDEFILCEKIHINKMAEMVRSGEIFDAKTITAVFLAKSIENGNI